MPGLYIARTVHGGVLVTEPSSYESVEAAIRSEALNIPADFAHFIEFSYGGMSTGTHLIEETPAKAGELADRLMALIHHMHLIDERNQFLIS